MRNNRYIISVSSRSVYSAGLIYITLPVALFGIFFLKPLIALLFTALLTLLIAGALKAPLSREISAKISISVPCIIILALCACLWAYISGIGEFTWTTEDHSVRYAILNDLTAYDWPVIYDSSSQSIPAVRDLIGEGKFAFSYYFIFWLIPALIGKLCGLFAARIALLLISAFGLLLVSAGIFCLCGRTGFAPFLVFFFFGGLDIIPYLIRTAANAGGTWEGWNEQLYIHGNYYQTMNTFNQSIPGWIITILVLMCGSPRHIGTIASLMFCYSPWATFGLLPIAVYELFSRLSHERTAARLRDIFTPGNLILPIMLLSVFGLFYTSNSGATSEKGFIWEFLRTPWQLLTAYILYIIVEFGIWGLFAFLNSRKASRNRGRLYVSFAILLLMPIYKITHANDFLMRGSLSPMFIIFLYSLPAFLAAFDRFREPVSIIKLGFRAVSTMILFVLMSITPLMLLITGIFSTALGPEQGEILPRDKIVSFGDIAHKDEADLVRLQFLVGDYEEKPFYKYLGKG